MDASEPRVRHRGFFLHSDPNGDPDTGEQDNPEGFVVRVRVSRSVVSRRVASAAFAGGRSGTPNQIESARPEIRSGSVTGSRQRAHLPR
jgi:hypothetical protein